MHVTGHGSPGKAAKHRRGSRRGRAVDASSAGRMAAAESTILATPSPTRKRLGASGTVSLPLLNEASTSRGIVSSSLSSSKTSGFYGNFLKGYLSPNLESRESRLRAKHAAAAAALEQRVVRQADEKVQQALGRPDPRWSAAVEARIQAAEDRALQQAAWVADPDGAAKGTWPTLQAQPSPLGGRSVSLPALESRRNSGASEAPLKKDGDRARRRMLREELNQIFAGVSDAEKKKQDEEIKLGKKKDACDSLRLLVFGRGNNFLAQRSADPVLEQQRGTRAEVRAFTDFWIELDADCTGTASFEEFQECVERRRKPLRIERAVCQRGIGYLLDRWGDPREVLDDSPEGLAARELGRCTKKDLMRAIWTLAGEEDLQAMEVTFLVRCMERLAQQPLPLLGRAELRGFQHTFKHCKPNSQNKVTFEAMIKEGLIDEDLYRKLQDEFDKGRTGELTFNTFVEILGPFGYRAHQDVDRAYREDGEPVIWVALKNCPLNPQERFYGWLMESDLDKLPPRKKPLAGLSIDEEKLEGKELC
eukprot:TRINITY_DN19882_c0_g1_i2.p1 TRINITY_DN19882_c0_g1~~TRINITY_DN19882_c0_g1_i2.p1  ORF type:complete len:573 (+),score=147.61 TRINITY_DN19882_c0_g1_i2:118-1719(+)